MTQRITNVCVLMWCSGPNEVQYNCTQVRDQHLHLYVGTATARVGVRYGYRLVASVHPLPDGAVNSNTGASPARIIFVPTDLFEPLTAISVETGAGAVAFSAEANGLPWEVPTITIMANHPTLPSTVSFTGNLVWDLLKANLTVSNVTGSGSSVTFGSGVTFGARFSAIGSGAMNLIVATGASVVGNAEIDLLQTDSASALTVNGGTVQSSVLVLAPTSCTYDVWTCFVRSSDSITSHCGV